MEDDDDDENESEDDDAATVIYNKDANDNIPDTVKQESKVGYFVVLCQNCLKFNFFLFGT